MQRMKAVLGIFVVVAAFYLAWKLMPPYFNNYQFQDDLEQEARQAVYTPTRTEQQIRDNVMKLARSEDIPIKPEDIKIQRGYETIVISVDYTVHIDLPIHPLDLHFQPTTKDKMI
jgi:uncharacterized protein DUF4845